MQMGTAENFRKSSFSNTQSACVELAVESTATSVRDTKARSAGTLTFSAAPFAEFVCRVKAGEHVRVS